MPLHLWKIKNQFVDFSMVYNTKMIKISSKLIKSGNKITTMQKSLVNGAYIAFYYSGGVVGSYLPGIVYKNFGWQSFIISLFILVVAGFFMVTKLSDHA